MAVEDRGQRLEHRIGQFVEPRQPAMGVVLCLGQAQHDGGCQVCGVWDGVVLRLVDLVDTVWFGNQEVQRNLLVALLGETVGDLADGWIPVEAGLDKYDPGDVRQGTFRGAFGRAAEKGTQVDDCRGFTDFGFRAFRNRVRRLLLPGFRKLCRLGSPLIFGNSIRFRRGGGCVEGRKRLRLAIAGWFLRILQCGRGIGRWCCIGLSRAVIGGARSRRFLRFDLFLRFLAQGNLYGIINYRSRPEKPRWNDADEKGDVGGGFGSLEFDGYFTSLPGIDVPRQWEALVRLDDTAARHRIRAAQHAANAHRRVSAGGQGFRTGVFKGQIRRQRLVRLHPFRDLDAGPCNRQQGVLIAAHFERGDGTGDVRRKQGFVP